MMQEFPEDAGGFFFLVAAPQNKIRLQSLLWEEYGTCYAQM